MKLKDKFNEKAEYIKNNLQLIIIVPAVLGGIWQVFELSSISTSYIRFFSVTQIIPDGLLILFYFITIYLSYKISMFIVNLNKVKENKNDVIQTTKDNEKRRKSNKYFFLSVFIVVVSVLLLYYYVLKPFVIENDSIQLSDILISIPISTFIITSISHNIIDIIIFISSKFKIDIKKVLEKTFFQYFLAYSATAFLFFSIILIISFFIYFSNLYKLPENLKNINNVTSIIKEKHPDEKIEILYINDKYIFVETTDSEKNKNKIVLKFDNLFNFNAKFHKNKNKTELRFDLNKTLKNEKKVRLLDSLHSNKVENK